MAFDPDRCPIEPRPDPGACYHVRATDAGDTIIYDEDREAAWLQSDSAIDVEAME